jgi:hypothetical protein
MKYYPIHSSITAKRTEIAWHARGEPRGGEHLVAARTANCSPVQVSGQMGLSAGGIQPDCAPSTSIIEFHSSCRQLTPRPDGCRINGSGARRNDRRQFSRGRRVRGFALRRLHFWALYFNDTAVFTRGTVRRIVRWAGPRVNSELAHHVSEHAVNCNYRLHIRD